jgi:probable HAF family extracellular repeat protein
MLETKTTTMRRSISTAMLCLALGLATPGTGAAQGAPTQAQRYTLTDLGPIGPAGQVLNISNNGLIAGAVTTPDNTDHAVLFYGRQRLDISTHGLGGPNSLAYGVNSFGQTVGGAETGKKDPGSVDFCGFQTLGLASPGAVCAAFIWQNGIMAKLPTLGGNNGAGSQINRWGVVAGEVENAAPDPGCPQRFQVRPVKWQGGKVNELSTYPGDPDAVAYAINDFGQVVGSSGTCAPYNPLLQLSMVPVHPLLWEADGTRRYLGTLGGSGTVFGNLAININNKGHVVGTSALTGDVTGHAFLWTSTGGIRDLQTLPGDEISGAVAINDSDQITGISISADGVPRAFVWQNGVMTDLNDLARPASLHLLSGTAINADGQIAGFAVDPANGDMHGFLATPRGAGGPSFEPGPQFTREDVWRIIQRIKPLSRHGIRFTKDR